MTRRPTWKILGGIVAALFVAIAAFFAWVQSTASRRWAELEARVPLLVAEARARDPRRPPRAGAPVPGNAWVDYNQAIMAIKPMNAADLGSFVARDVKADRAKAEAAVATYGSALAFLAAGARKAEGTYPFAFEKGFAADLPGLLETQKLGNLAVSQARMLAEAGKAKEAMEPLLDLLWFAADTGRNTVLIGEMISSANLALGLDEIRSMAIDPDAKGVDWPEVGRALATLDTIWPDHGESLLNDAATATVTLAKDGPEGAGLGTAGALVAWRYGFSTRLLVVDAMDTHLDAMRRQAAAKTWPEAEKAAKEIEAELQASSNLLTKILTPGLMSSHRVGFERRAQLSLLRKAVALRAGLALELDDPFGGGKLKSDVDKVWSVGQDGVDGGGIGAWRPAKTGDIVLLLQKDALDLKKK